MHLWFPKKIKHKKMTIKMTLSIGCKLIAVNEIFK